jgi:hypothetical protein
MVLDQWLHLEPAYHACTVLPEAILDRPVDVSDDALLDYMLQCLPEMTLAHSDNTRTNHHIDISKMALRIATTADSMLDQWFAHDNAESMVRAWQCWINGSRMAMLNQWFAHGNAGSMVRAWQCWINGSRMAMLNQWFAHGNAESMVRAWQC